MNNELPSLRREVTASYSKKYAKICLEVKRKTNNKTIRIVLGRAKIRIVSLPTSTQHHRQNPLESHFQLQAYSVDATPTFLEILC
jgi:hypothetical protein